MRRDSKNNVSFPETTSNRTKKTLCQFPTFCFSFLYFFYSYKDTRFCSLLFYLQFKGMSTPSTSTSSSCVEVQDEAIGSVEIVAVGINTNQVCLIIISRVNLMW